MTPDPDARLWEALDRLVASSRVVIDRPAGSRHPRFPEVVYPLDYGYLAGTTAADGNAIDVWVGSAEEHGIVAIACTLDLLKRDLELKILLSCTETEAERIQQFHNTEKTQVAYLIRRPPPSGEGNEEVDSQ
ncbi:MAG: inorganic pyrophosphatase [Candidatus Bipolaricaulota bacterium]|nr:inorganic pyrophosphatase [Candidatus Bipolaricaulota bacterium]